MTKEIFIPKSVIDNANENRLVFFIGSGFSKDFGFPVWDGLVESMLKRIIEDSPKFKPFLELLRSKTIDVLSVLDHIKSEKRIIRDTIYREFKYDSSKFDLLNKHRKLLKISSKLITTNYDQLLEKAAEGDLERIVYTNAHLIGQISNLDSFIFKIHGDHEDADKCILFKEDYEKLYNEDNSALAQFKNIVTSNTILFVGFSLSDPYVRNLFEYIKNLYSGYNEKSYILTTNDEDFSNYNVTNIKLDGYDDILSFLDQLYDKVSEKQLPIKKIEEEIEVDEDEFKSFILDFNNNRKKNVILDFTEEEIEKKYEKMVCSESFKKEIEDYSAYFPSIDEIMMSPSYIDFDKKTIITSIIKSAYNRLHNKYNNGESIFEVTVDEIYTEYSVLLTYSKTKLKFYIKVLVAWAIVGCDIFNEDKRN